MLLIFLTTTFLFHDPSFAEGSLFDGNDQYIVSVNNKSTLLIFNVENKQLFQEKLNVIIERVEICPNYPFVSVVGYPIGYSGKPGFLDREYFIYDIEHKRLYGKYYLDEDEKRWSVSGEYTYIYGGINIILIPTKLLREYLIDSENIGNKKEIIRIKGHPIGSMAQIAWIKNRIYYINGIDEIRCWGVYNTETKKNYFITCCGMIKKENFNEKCNYETNDIVKLAIIMESENRLKEISNEFHTDVSKIIEEEDRRNNKKSP